MPTTINFPFPVVLTPTSATLFVGGEPVSTPSTSPTWSALVDLIHNGGPGVTAEQVLELASPARYLATSLSDVDAVEIRDGSVWFRGQRLDNVVGDIVLDVVRDGCDPQAWVNFADKVFANPSEFAREELYEWLTKAEMPIAPDGDFYAYKYVRNDYKDAYSGKFDNSVGQVVEMPRDAVNPNRNNHCAPGLHFCSLDYLKDIGGGGGVGNRLMLVKINPADVVSIPSDYKFTKGRTCRYSVVDELDFDFDKLTELSWSSVLDVFCESLDLITAESADRVVAATV
jgi:hypothetical protein